MVAWSDVVTTALLGTERRPLPAEPERPEQDPAALVLAHAARHRAAIRAGAVLPNCPPYAGGPPQTLPLAPPAAETLVRHLLTHPVPDLINCWLAAAVGHHLGLAPVTWVPLALLAVRRPEIDRGLLAAALGARGRWLVEQNPQWRRLAASLRELPDPHQARATPPCCDVLSVRLEIAAAFGDEVAPVPAMTWPAPSAAALSPW